MIRASKKTRQRRRKIAEMDAECRAAVFERDGHACVKCGNSWEKSQLSYPATPVPKLDWAHVITRRDITLRHDPENSMVLCAKCHFWWHEHTLEAVTWFQQTFPLRYEYLMEVRRTMKRVRV